MPDSAHGVVGTTRSPGAATALPVEGAIDLSGPGRYEGSFAIAAVNRSEREIEWRIGGVDHYLFVRVRCGAMVAELSSGLFHRGARCESSHGVCSGASVAKPLILDCLLKIEGKGLVVEARVKRSDESGETLIFGCARIEGAMPGSRAIVRLGDRDADREVAWVEQVRRAGQSPVGSINRELSPPAQSSRVRLCEADQWYEFEAPSLRLAGNEISSLHRPHHY